MALIWMDGFDTYVDYNTTGGADVTSRYPGAIASNLVAGIFDGSGQAVRAFSSSPRVRLPLPALVAGDTNQRQWGFGVRFKLGTNVSTTLVGTAGTGLPFFKWYDASGTTSGQINIDENGDVIVVTTGGYRVSDGSHRITHQVASYVQVDMVLGTATGDSNAGSCAIILDGKTIFSEDGIGTHIAGSTGADTCELYVEQNTLVGAIVDDFYVTNGGVLGEGIIRQHFPTADTADKDWTASSGSDNFAMLDEATVSGSDYVKASVAGDKDLYGVTDLGADVATVLGVDLVNAFFKGDTQLRRAKGTIKSGSTEANGTTQTLTSTPVLSRKLFTTDPDTGVAWSLSGVNAVQIGQEVV